MIQDRANTPRRSVEVGRPLQALPSWLISLGVHALLGVCLIPQFEREGIPDGSGRGTRARSLQLTASFSSTEVTGESGKVITTEIAQEPQEPNAVPQGNAAATDTQEVPPEPDQAVAATELPADPPAQEMAAEEGPAEQLSPADIEELATRTARPVQRPGQQPRQRPGRIASRLTSAPSNDGTENEEADGNAIGLAAAGEGAGERFGNPNGTSFFQVRSQGQHFCYVVDCSSSMEDDNTIGVVRDELKASLQRLDSSKRFQVLFYDAELHPLTDGRKTILLATDVNRRLAQQFIDGQQPTGRALHRSALLHALQTRPDVIFFLTDGEVPELTARDLHDLKSANRIRTRVHVIEFGKGAKLETNWLDQLARDHRGIYRYEDIDSQ